MTASDVQDTPNLALEASGLDEANVLHRPRLLSDNGPSYISGDLAECLADKGMKHTRGAPYHPQIQGKIERWHQTLKNRILLENYFLPGDLEAQIDAFVGYYNHHRYPQAGRRCLQRREAREPEQSHPAISPRPMSTQVTDRPSCSNGKRPKGGPWNNGACSTTDPLLN